MLNDLLTGKAEPADERVPYRTQDVPVERRTCARCTRSFEAKRDAPAGLCGPCHFEVAEQQSLEYQRNVATLRRTTARTRRWAAAGAIGVTLLFALARFGLREGFRSSDRDDAATGASPAVVPSPDDVAARAEMAQFVARAAAEDPYVVKTASFRDAMCRCTDVGCARGVRERYRAWRETPPPPNAAVEAAASAAVDELRTCAVDLETRTAARSAAGAQ